MGLFSMLGTRSSEVTWHRVFGQRYTFREVCERVAGTVLFSFIWVTGTGTTLNAFGKYVVEYTTQFFLNRYVTVKSKLIEFIFLIPVKENGSPDFIICKKLHNLIWTMYIGGPKGYTRNTCPLSVSPISLIFVGIISPNIRLAPLPFGLALSSLWEILDPPLMYYQFQQSDVGEVQWKTTEYGCDHFISVSSSHFLRTK